MFSFAQTQETSELSTFNEYDIMTDDDAVMTTSYSPPERVPRTIIPSEDDGDSGRSSEGSRSESFSFYHHSS